MDAVNDVLITQDGEIADKLIVETYELNHWRNLAGNINLKHNFDADHFINIDVDYLYYHDNNPTEYTNNFYSSKDSLLQEEKINSKKKRNAIYIANDSKYK